jgi:hypothetical protein
MIETGSNNQFFIIDDSVEQIDFNLNIGGPDNCIDCSDNSNYVDLNGIVPHNQLGGLQGGSILERYHTTKIINDALIGAASPSSTNVFVTMNDLPDTIDITQFLHLTGSQQTVIQSPVFANSITVNGGAFIGADLKVLHSGNGLVLSAPNGTYYRVQVTNSGTLNITAI